MTQINPPFDGSAPCPACQQELRSLSALLHNFLTRCGRARVSSNKAFVRLVDMRHSFPAELAVPHPAAQEVVDVCRALVAAIEGIEVTPATIRWSPEILAAVEALIPRAMQAADAFALIADVHFEDARHSRGEPNILRESQGMRHGGFMPHDSEADRYHYTVERVGDRDADIVHAPCGTGLRLHQHFKDRMVADPTFYGKIYCQACGMNAPAEQFGHIFRSAEIRQG